MSLASILAAEREAHSDLLADQHPIHCADQGTLDRLAALCSRADYPSLRAFCAAFGWAMSVAEAAEVLTASTAMAKAAGLGFGPWDDLEAFLAEAEPQSGSIHFSS